MISRHRYSAEAHEALNAHVNGLISETHSVAAVRSHLEENEEHEGTTAGVAPGSIAGAKALCKDVLKNRLRESASDAIFAGRKRLNGDHLSRFGSSLADAQACGWLDGEVQFAEFSQLLRNYQVRSEASQCNDHVAAESLIQQLRAHIQPPAEGETHLPLTDATLVTVLHSLLATMRRSREAYDKLVNLGIVEVVSRLFLAEGLDYKVQAPNPDFPEVQMCLAQVLAEVALQSAHECAKSVELDASQLRALQMAVEDGPADRQPPPPPLPPPISDEAQSAIKTLLVGLKESIRRSEHAAVWAVILALQRLSAIPFACEQLLTAGFLPVLRNARQNYIELASSGRLPLAIPRPKPRPPAVTKVVPGFVGAVAEPPALSRASSSAKHRWLSNSHSSPSLSLQDSSPILRPGAEWLAGSPVASKPQRKRGQTTQMSRVGRMALHLEKPEDAGSFPSLLWLIGEDSVDKESFNRVCDRSFMLLQLQKLLRTLEKAHVRLGQSPFVQAGIVAPSPPPSRGLMGNRTGSISPSRGGMGSRGGSRGGGRSRASLSTLPPPAKGSDMYDQRSAVA